jgi:MoxR-like ATPase
VADWKLFNGTRQRSPIRKMPPPPPWRPYRTATPTTRTQSLNVPGSPAFEERATTFQSTPAITEAVNAALYLRRPLLVTGHPGTGKSSLVDAVAYELGLEEPLRWAVTSRSTLRDALYRYDALGRLQELQLNRRLDQAPDIGEYLELGALGTAMLPSFLPRALLIDEIDKADVDLPNDLLNIFEEGEFEIPELSRLKETTVEVRQYGSNTTVSLTKGRIACFEFPFVVLTSNGERDFPPPFLRRCIRVEMPDPWKDPARMQAIVDAHFDQGHRLSKAQKAKATELVEGFIKRAEAGAEILATDQLLNAIYLVTQATNIDADERSRLVERITQALNVERT